MALGMAGPTAQAQPTRADSPSAPLEREAYVTTPDSLRLYYRVVGRGPQTVIIPAALYHRKTLDGLAIGRRLVLYDPRGRGQSDTVPMSKAGLEHSMADLETIRQAVGLESFALVGWSALGLEAFAYAASHPGRVTRLAMLAPLPARRNPYWEQLLTRRRGRVDPAAQAKLDARIAAGEFTDREAALCREIAHLGDRAAFGDTSFAHLAPDVCDSPNEWPTRYAMLSKTMLASYGDNYDWRPRLGEVSVPQLVIHGDSDNFPLDGSREWVAGRPNARLLVFPGAGHWLQYERPKELLQALDRFLRGHWPRDARVVAR